MPFAILKSTKDFAADIKFHSGIFLFDFQNFAIYKQNSNTKQELSWCFLSVLNPVKT